MLAGPFARLLRARWFLTVTACTSVVLAVVLVTAAARAPAVASLGADDHRAFSVEAVTGHVAALIKQSAQAPLDVHVDAATCTEQASGFSPDDAVCSLDDANDRLLMLADAGLARGDVDVRIEPGVYESAPVEWTFNPVADSTLRFLPSWQHHGSEPRKERVRPIIRGDNSPAANDDAGFTYFQTGTEQTGAVEFHHLQFEHWGVAGLIVYGGVDTGGHPSEITSVTAPPIQDIVIRGNLVRDVGSIAIDGSRAEAGIGISNTHRAVVRDNTIHRVANVEEGQGTYAHAVYLRRATETEITDNRFSLVSGDTVRIRDRSDNAQVHDNSYERAGGINGAVGLYFRDIRTAIRDGRRSECESHGTVVREANPGTDWEGAPQQPIGGIYNRPHLQVDACFRGGTSGG